MTKHLTISEFIFHPDLEKMSFTTFKKFIKLLSQLDVDKATYCSTHKLYVLEDLQKKEPELLTKHHIYMLMRELGQTEFTVEIVNTTEEANTYLSIDRANTMRLCKVVEANKTQSNSADTHQKRRAAGQVCPLCGGPLELQLGEKGKLLVGDQAYRRVQCHYRTKKGYICNFQVYLNLKSVKLFRKYDYPTAKWLTKKGICHKCKSPLFELKQETGSTLQICFGRKFSLLPGDHCRYDRLPDKP